MGEKEIYQDAIVFFDPETDQWVAGVHMVGFATESKAMKVAEIMSENIENDIMSHSKVN